MATVSVLPDRQYVMPTWTWVSMSFSQALHKLQNALTIQKWLAEANDCDDFARVSAAFAQVLHTNTPGRPEGTALAFGEFWYKQDKGGGHAINVVLTGRDGEEKIEVKFYEPQTRKFVQLSEPEKLSAMMVRI